MPEISISLIVLRTASLDASLAFYRALGLTLTEEQHGTGPIHYSATLGPLVFELYPGKLGEKIDYRVSGATMLGFTVASLDDTLTALTGHGSRTITARKVTQWGTRAVVEDPDGRAVEINEPLA